ncbi:MAG: M66 family metalloprotease [Deltaproteobacteria bacterium]
MRGAGVIDPSVVSCGVASRGSEAPNMRFLAMCLGVSAAMACGGPAPLDGGDAGRVADADDVRATADVLDANVAPLDVAVDAPLPVDPSPSLAGDLDLTDVSLFQSVRVGLVTMGAAAATRNAPVVAGRAAVVRAYVNPRPAFVPRDLTARLVISRAGVADVALTDTRRITGASSDSSAASAFAFDVAAELVAVGARFSVAVLDPGGAPAAIGTPASARAPRDGATLELGALTDAGGLELVLVPLRYDTDGSGRMPDTSDPQLARIRALLTSLYPLRDVNLVVHAPVGWNGSLTFTGNVNFSAVNQLLVDLRQSDMATSRQYYYGLVAPAADFAAYCGRSCVTGQSYVVATAADASTRAGSGVGWGTEDSAWTLAHEVGHELGRSHAPCGAGGADPSYPYSGGFDGVWGYDRRSATFLPPQSTYDFMGYCDPTWISDYTYAAIFQRVREVNGAGAFRAGPEDTSLIEPTPYRFVRVPSSGDARWERAVSLRLPARGVPDSFRFLDARGRVLGVGLGRSIQESDAAPGERLYLVSVAPAGTAAIEIVPEGRSVAVR